MNTGDLLRNEHQRLVANIKKVNSLLQEKIADIVCAEGITPQQYHIMCIVIEYPGMSTLDIRGKMADRFSDVSRVTDRMVKSEMVRKEISPRDKRMLTIFLTDKGVEVWRKCNDKIRSEHFGISVSKTEIINDILETITIQ